MARVNPGRPGELRAELVVERRRRTSRVAGLGLPHLRRRGGRGEAAAPGGELRRPLQPGAAVLREPDTGRAEAHPRRVRVRAQQGRARPTSARGWWRTCATSTRTSRPRSPRISGWTRCRTRSVPAAPAGDRSGAVTRAEHRRERSRALRRPQGRGRARRRRDRRGRSSTSCARGRGRGVARRAGGAACRRRSIAADGGPVQLDHMLRGGPSVVFDAVVLLTGVVTDPRARGGCP